MVIHTFTNKVIVLGQYYVNFLGLPEFVAMMTQLPFTVEDYNRAIGELEGFADPAGLKDADKKKSQKLSTAIPKLHKLLMMLNNYEVNQSNGVEEFDYKLDVLDLGVIPGHSHLQLVKSVDMLTNVMEFMNKAISNISKNAKSSQEEPVTDSATPPPVPVAPVEQSEKKKQSADKRSTPKPDEVSFTEVVQKAKQAKSKNSKPKQTNVKPAPSVPTALKPIRLWIGKGDFDINEKRIRTWSSDWKVFNNKLEVVQITRRSFVASFQSRLRNFKVPPGVKSGIFRRQGPLLSYKERKLATRWYVSGVCSDVSEDEVLREIHQGFDNIDQKLTVIRRLPATKAKNCGNYTYDNRYWIKLVSETNGYEPSRKYDDPMPFKLKPWLTWKRLPRSNSGVDPGESTLAEQSDSSAGSKKTSGRQTTAKKSVVAPHMIRRSGKAGKSRI